MMTPHSISRLASLALAAGLFTMATMATLATARAEPTPQAPQGPPAVVRARAEPPASASTGPVKKCRSNEDTLRVLTLTTFDGGVRVDYEFAVSGRATWSDTNRPLLKQSGVKAGRTLCLPRDTHSADATPVE